MDAMNKMLAKDLKNIYMCVSCGSIRINAFYQKNQRMIYRCHDCDTSETIQLVTSFNCHDCGKPYSDPEIEYVDAET